jgi:hypothetical protein
MTTATKPRPRPSAGPTDGAAHPADVLVVFGITGDLAKVMTFRSLQEVDEEILERFAGRLSYTAGSWQDPWED